MRIWVLNPRQWSFAKQCSVKMKIDTQKWPKQAKDLAKLISIFIITIYDILDDDNFYRSDKN